MRAQGLTRVEVVVEETDKGQTILVRTIDVGDPGGTSLIATTDPRDALALAFQLLHAVGEVDASLLAEYFVEVGEEVESS